MRGYRLNLVRGFILLSVASKLSTILQQLRLLNGFKFIYN